MDECPTGRRLAIIVADRDVMAGREVLPFACRMITYVVVLGRPAPRLVEIVEQGNVCALAASGRLSVIVIPAAAS
jgi:hypothetical protein